MKGQLKETVKKWWVLVVVATLALSLTSCGKRRSSYLTGGENVCSEGNLGEFAIEVLPYGNGQLEIRILVLAVEDGAIIDIGLINDRTISEPKKEQLVVFNGDEISFYISQAEYNKYDHILFSSTHVGSGQFYAGYVAPESTACEY